MSQSALDKAMRELGVGASVRPYRVGGTSVRPFRVGAPARRVAEGEGEEAVEYGEDEYSAGGNSYFGLGRSVIPGNGILDVQKNPIRPFEPMQFRIPSTIVGLEIVQIDIQGVQFFANKSADGMPSELFSEVSRIGGFTGITIQPDTGVTVSVRNITGADIVFRGGFWGTQVRR